MANLVICHVFLVTSLVVLVGAEAGNNFKEFETLKDDVFGQSSKLFENTSVEKKIHRMIELIESGDIPAKVQGEQTLEYLKSMTDDCEKRECNLDEDLERFRRIEGRRTVSSAPGDYLEGIPQPGAPNLETYLNLCQLRISTRCQSDLIKRTSNKLSSVSEESMKAVDALANQLDVEMKAREFGIYQPDADYIDHKTVLGALERLDPDGSKKMLKKWTNKKEALAKLMDEIRLPCVEFLDHVDEGVKLFPARYDFSEVSRWHYYQACCKIVVDNWDTIVEDASSSY